MIGSIITRNRHRIGIDELTERRRREAKERRVARLKHRKPARTTGRGVADVIMGRN